MPGFGMVAYTGNAGIGAINFDLTALTDPDFTQRNGHYTFTEPYQLLGSFALGANLIRARFQVPTWNAIGEANIYPVNRSAAVIPSNPQWDWNVYNPPPVPVNEEFQIQTSNNNAGTEQDFALLLLGTTDWNRNIPAGKLPIEVRATCAITGIANAWSGPFPITLSQSLRGGTYALCGAQCQVANGVAFRIVFPRYRLYHGRKLRPGWICHNAIGDNLPYEMPYQQWSWGEWGRFHTFELPQAEALMNAAGAATLEMRFWLVFIDESLNPMSQGLGGGS